jgi:hypothetical protein
MRAQKREIPRFIHHDSEGARNRMIPLSHWFITPFSAVRSGAGALSTTDPICDKILNVTIASSFNPCDILNGPVTALMKRALGRRGAHLNQG